MKLGKCIKCHRAAYVEKGCSFCPNEPILFKDSLAAYQSHVTGSLVVFPVRRKLTIVKDTSFTLQIIKGDK